MALPPVFNSALVTSRSVQSMAMVVPMYLLNRLVNTSSLRPSWKTFAAKPCMLRSLWLTLRSMKATRINLTDPAAVERKLATVQQLYESKLADLIALQREVEHLGGIVHHLAAWVGNSHGRSDATAASADGNSGRLAPAQQAVVAVVDRARRPLRT